MPVRYCLPSDSKPLSNPRSGRFLAFLIPLAVIACAHPADPADAKAKPGPPSDGPSLNVRFVQPSDGQYVRGIVQLLVDAADGRPIHQVTFLQGDTVIGFALEPPFLLAWDTTKLHDGPHTIVAKARDSDFRAGSARVSVTVDNVPPTVAWRAPDGAGCAVANI